MSTLDDVKAYQKRLTDAGLCVGCRNPNDSLPLRKCSSCRKLDSVRMKEWKKNNQDKVKVNTKKYYAKHSEKERNRLRLWEEENPERAKLTTQTYNRKYREQNKDKVEVYRKTRKARVRKAEGKFSSAEWISLKLLHGNKCLWCGSTSRPLTADHVIPVTRGGNNYIENIQPLCANCNSKKRTKILDFRPFGSGIMEWT